MAYCSQRSETSGCAKRRNAVIGYTIGSKGTVYAFFFLLFSVSHQLTCRHRSDTRCGYRIVRTGRRHQALQKRQKTVVLYVGFETLKHFQCETQRFQKHAIIATCLSASLDVHEKCTVRVGKVGFRQTGKMVGSDSPMRICLGRSDLGVRDHKFLGALPTSNQHDL